MNNLEYNSDSDSNYDSEYDSEYDAEEEDLYIESDNVSNTRFNIVLCELYYKLHGNNKEDKIFYFLEMFWWSNNQLMQQRLSLGLKR